MACAARPATLRVRLRGSMNDRSRFGSRWETAGAGKAASRSGLNKMGV